MGNNTSSQPEKEKFGSIHGGDKVRPGYYVSKKKVMYGGSEIALLPEETDFIKLKYGYAKTNKRVFFRGIPIHGADPKSFTTITRQEAAKNQSKLNSVLGIDYQSNQKRIYHFGTLIKVL